jgi:hypothetical protein
MILNKDIEVFVSKNVILRNHDNYFTSSHFQIEITINAKMILFYRKESK